MSKESAVAELKAQKYVQAVPGMATPNHRLCHTIYVVHGKPGFYESSSRSANAVILKLRRYFETKDPKHLPIVVQRWVADTDLEVEIWVLKNQFLNYDIMPKLLMNGYKEMQRKERDAESVRNVFKMQLKGVPGIKLISSINKIGNVRSAFLTQCKDQADRTHNSEVPEFRQWCIDNLDAFNHTNLECDVVASGLSKADAIEFIRNYKPTTEEGFVMGRV